MLDHVSIGVKSVPTAKKFYDAALKPLGYECLSSGDGYAGYGGGRAIQFWLGETDHPVKADKRSGLHFCFKAESKEAVDAFYKAALRAGAEDNGKPGIRAEYTPGYYAAFVIDPEGYRLEAYCKTKA
ncbi:MAG: VOC family protein [Alphaproteobacteria bacterium]|nr:VOC family protein [Alphaproteobacteria bacterium]